MAYEKDETTPHNEQLQPRELVKHYNHNKIGNKTSSTIRLATLNARSVKHKDDMVVDKFIKAKIAVGLLTETWLKDTPEDQAWVNQPDLTQSNFTTRTSRLN